MREGGVALKMIAGMKVSGYFHHAYRTYIAIKYNLRACVHTMCELAVSRLDNDTAWYLPTQC